MLKKNLNINNLNLFKESSMKYNNIVTLELAKEENLPPYIICSDKTLMDMCAKMPKNKDELLDVYGMGAQKVESYGEEFIDAIKRFIVENCVNRDDLLSRMTIASDSETGVEEKIVAKKKEKIPFSMSAEAWDRFVFSEKTMVKEIAIQINELKGDNGTNKITAVMINNVLVEEGYLSNEVVDGKNVKRVTEKGFIAGINEELRKASSGDEYYAITHGEEVQKVIVELLRERYSS